MRIRVGPLALALAVALSLALSSSPASASATAKTAPPLTSLQVCTAFPARIVAKELGKHTQPVASPGYSSKLTSVDFAVYCSYRFSAASLLNIVFYGPARVVAEAAGSKVPALGPQAGYWSALHRFLLVRSSTGFLTATRSTWVGQQPSAGVH